MARSLLYNGLMQNDMDAAGHRILNLDTSNLNIGGGPISFPAQANKWLKSYDAVSRLFTGTQPLITEIGGFPAQAGNNGKFLSTNGTVLAWGSIPATYIHVKAPPYNAVGDGVTNDYAAIAQAIADAAGKTVYLPTGVYLLGSNLNISSACSLVGDGPRSTILRGVLTETDNIITLASYSIIRSLGIDGNLSNATQ